jgi:DNA-binding GntR family transcriptional regulator
MTKRRLKRGFDDPTAPIRDAIIGGSFLPNERLIEEDLVRRFRANRGTVRLALARLEQEGLVVREPNRGARVRLVSGREAIEIMEARAMLESLVARHAALKVTEQDIENLRAILRELEGLIEEGDMVGYAAANMRFHSTIVDIADHPTAARLLLGLRAQSVVFQYRQTLQPGRVAILMHEHEELVRALASRDPGAAEEAMRSHLDNTAAALKARLQRSSC